MPEFHAIALCIHLLTISFQRVKRTFKPETCSGVQKLCFAKQYFRIPIFIICPMLKNIFFLTFNLCLVNIFIRKTKNWSFPPRSHLQVGGIE